MLQLYVCSLSLITTWKLNRGFYERLVKAVKLPLKKVLGRSMVWKKELETLLVEIEALVNSRPLTHVSGDDELGQPLTPAMLMGLTWVEGHKTLLISGLLVFFRPLRGSRGVSDSWLGVSLGSWFVLGKFSVGNGSRFERLSLGSG